MKHTNIKPIGCDKMIDITHSSYPDSLEQVSIATYCLECNKAFYINQ